jgi:hypothetical protein
MALFGLQAPMISASSGANTSRSGSERTFGRVPGSRQTAPFSFWPDMTILLRGGGGRPGDFWPVLQSDSCLWHPGRDRTVNERSLGGAPESALAERGQPSAGKDDT